MRRSRRKKAVLVASSAALVALGTSAWWILRERPKGRLLCPASMIAKPNQLRVGSFVVLQLASMDGTFAEPTWAKIIGRTLLGKLEVEIVGEIDENGEAHELDTSKHGYALGQELDVSARCLWDVYRPPLGISKLICGSALAQIPTDAIGHEPDPNANRLRKGDEAAVVVAAAGRAVEVLWLRVESSSPGAQSFTGRVIDPTEHAEIHGIEQGDTLQFVRDCVVDVRIGPVQ